MAKIRVEFEIPDDGCDRCIMFDNEYRFCELFDCYRRIKLDNGNYDRCDKCKQAEVQNAENKD